MNDAETIYLKKASEFFKIPEAVIEHFLPYFERADIDFDVFQYTEIKKGFQNGLSPEQVKVYAEPTFNNYQMQEIRFGFELGLTLEQVQLYAEPSYSSLQMAMFKDSFVCGLTTENAKTFADPKFSVDQMEQIADGMLRYNLSKEQVLVCAKTAFAHEYMADLKIGLYTGLSPEQALANANFLAKWRDISIESLEPNPKTLEALTEYKRYQTLYDIVEGQPLEEHWKAKLQYKLNFKAGFNDLYRKIKPFIKEYKNFKDNLISPTRKPSLNDIISDAASTKQKNSDKDATKHKKMTEGPTH